MHSSNRGAQLACKKGSAFPGGAVFSCRTATHVASPDGHYIDQCHRWRKMESQGRTHTPTGSGFRPRIVVGEFHLTHGRFGLHIDLPQGGGLFSGLSRGLEFRAALVSSEYRRQRDLKSCPAKPQISSNSEQPPLIMAYALAYPFLFDISFLFSFLKLQVRWSRLAASFKQTDSRPGQC